MIKLLVGLSLLISSTVFGQSSENQETYTISVTVKNITSEEGQIGLALYNKDDFMRYLEEQASCIEYIDSIESENAFISKDIYTIDKRTFTHLF